jgi:hypothetical protein
MVWKKPEKTLSPTTDGWFFTVSVCVKDDGEYIRDKDSRYDVMTFEELNPKHQPAVALLMAALSSAEVSDDFYMKREATIPGVGVVEDSKYGPWFFLEDY